MNRLLSNLQAITGLLRQRKVKFALVGGLAVSSRATPRFTQDIDLALSVAKDRDAEQLVQDISSHGYRIMAVVEQEATQRLAAVRLLSTLPERKGVVVDLLFASSGIEAEIVQQAEKLEIVAGLPLPIARTGHLIALKVLARDDSTRPQDTQDLGSLMAKARQEDLDLARSALQLIEERGFQRGRNLLDLFAQAKTLGS